MKRTPPSTPEIILVLASEAHILKLKQFLVFCRMYDAAITSRWGVWSHSLITQRSVGMLQPIMGLWNTPTNHSRQVEACLEGSRRRTGKCGCPLRGTPALSRRHAFSTSLYHFYGRSLFQMSAKNIYTQQRSFIDMNLNYKTTLKFKKSKIIIFDLMPLP